MSTTYYDLAAQYGIDNMRHLGNKVLVIDKNYKMVIGYTIETYNGYTPDLLKNKVYTKLSNTGYDWDKAYDFLFGTPAGKPDFTKVVQVVGS